MSTDTEETKFEDPIFKHYFKTKDRGGLLSITPWNEASKFKIDIGATDANDKLVGATAGYVEFIELAAFLRAVVNHTAQHSYVERDKQRNVLSVATLVQYGGAVIDGQPVSRIVKIQPDGDVKSHERFEMGTDFQWKTGHFAARKLANGAFIPDMSKPLSQNLIKVTRRAMGAISYKIDLHILKQELTHA